MIQPAHNFEHAVLDQKVYAYNTWTGKCHEGYIHEVTRYYVAVNFNEDKEHPIWFWREHGAQQTTTSFTGGNFCLQLFWTKPELRIPEPPKPTTWEWWVGMHPAVDGIITQPTPNRLNLAGWTHYVHFTITELNGKVEAKAEVIQP